MKKNKTFFLSSLFCVLNYVEERSSGNSRFQVAVDIKKDKERDIYSFYLLDLLFPYHTINFLSLIHFCRFLVFKLDHTFCLVERE